MSYARFGWDDSDVYVYMDTRGYLCCCGCLFDEELTGLHWEFNSTAEMASHLESHVLVGHRVPRDVIPALWADDAENFPAGAA